MIQNAGLCNAGERADLPDRCLSDPAALICTHRGAPGVKDEPRRERKGRITGRMFDTMERLQER